MESSIPELGDQASGKVSEDTDPAGFGSGHGDGDFTPKPMDSAAALAQVSTEELLDELAARGLGVHHSLTAQFVAAKYRLENVLDDDSAGRQCAVFSATNNETGEPVVIKTVATASPLLQAGFPRAGEVEIWRTLQHPRLVNLIEVFQSESVVWLVMEPMAGDLYAHVAASAALPGDPFSGDESSADDGPSGPPGVESGSSPGFGRWTEARVRGVAVQCLQALGYLHRSGVCHLDVKPANLLVKDLELPPSSCSTGRAGAGALDGLGLATHISGGFRHPVVKLCDLGAAQELPDRRQHHLGFDPNRTLKLKRARPLVFAHSAPGSSEGGNWEKAAEEAGTAAYMAPEVWAAAQDATGGRGVAAGGGPSVVAQTSPSPSSSNELSTNSLSFFSSLGLGAAPSQAHRRFGPSADLWALGATLAELLTGRVPGVMAERDEASPEAFVAAVLRFKSGGALAVEQLFETEDWAFVSPQGREFVKSLLHPDPGRRPSAKEALAHEWTLGLAFPPAPLVTGSSSLGLNKRPPAAGQEGLPYGSLDLAEAAARLAKRHSERKAMRSSDASKSSLCERAASRVGWNVALSRPAPPPNHRPSELQVNDGGSASDRAKPEDKGSTAAKLSASVASGALTAAIVWASLFRKY